MKKISLKGASADSIFLAFAKVLTLLFAIISAKILSTGLSLVEYGTYSQANLVNSLGASIIMMGLGDALNYFYNKKHEGMDEQTRYRIVNTVFFLELILGVVFVMLVFLGNGLIMGYFDNPNLKPFLIIVSFIPMLSNSIYFIQILYVSLGKAKIMSLISIIMMIVRIVMIYYAVYVLKELILIYAVIIFLDIINIVANNLVLAKKKVYINPFKISQKHIVPILKYGFPMGIYALTNMLTRDIDKLVVARLEGTEQLAIYTNCSKPLPLDFLVTSFAVVLIPYIVKYVTEKNKGKSVELFSCYLKVGYYSVWILATLLLIAPETTISFLYDDKYVVGKWIFVLYILDSMIRFASMHLILTSANKAKSLMLYSAISLALNFGLNILLYYWIGIIGPAIATTIVAIVYTFMVVRKTLKTLDVKWLDVFDLKEIGWLIFTIVAMWALMVGLNFLLCAANVHKYLSMIICMAVFGFSMLAIHFKKIAATLKKLNSFRI